MVGYVGSPILSAPECIPDPPEMIMPARPMKSSLAELILMQRMLDPYGSKAGLGREPVSTKPCGLTGDKWSKRKSRSRMVRASKKRNRK